MKKISLEEIERRIKIRFPLENFQIIKYQTLGKPGKVKCLKCNQIIEISKFNNFFAKNKKYGCKNCNGLWLQREEKINKIKKYYNIIDTKVKNTHTYYKIKCKQCGHVRETTLNNIIKHLKCGCKTGVYKNRNGQQFINECNKYYNNELELVGKYINQTTKVLIRHKPCGMIWLVRPADIIHGKSHCPKCRTYESLGAKRIKDFLKLNNIDFEQEKKLNNSKQRFDFFLPKYNLAIEYNGKQHYYFIPFFHKTQKGFKEYQDRDNKKYQYCKKNKINLLIISYKEDNNIEKILSQYLNKFND